MVKLAKRYRGYGWENNKGYGTAEHASGIERHGVCAHHRRSFAPIQRILAESAGLAPREDLVPSRALRTRADFADIGG
jgi:ribonuclease HII